MPKWIEESITLRRHHLASGREDTREVVALVRAGVAVCQFEWQDGSTAGPDWQAVHVASGLAFGTFRRRKDAKRYALAVAPLLQTLPNVLAPTSPDVQTVKAYCDAWHALYGLEVA